MQTQAVCFHNLALYAAQRFVVADKIYSDRLCDKKGLSFV